MGFPLGRYTVDTNKINNSYPFPFTKSSIVSTPIFIEDDIEKIYLDGINNAGFSGSPVFTTIGTEKNINIIGIVKGYLPEENELNTNFGKIYFDNNSGIIEVHCVSHINDILNKKQN